MHNHSENTETNGTSVPRQLPLIGWGGTEAPTGSIPAPTEKKKRTRATKKRTGVHITFEHWENDQVGDCSNDGRSIRFNMNVDMIRYLVETRNADVITCFGVFLIGIWRAAEVRRVAGEKSAHVDAKDNLLTPIGAMLQVLGRVTREQEKADCMTPTVGDKSAPVSSHYGDHGAGARPGATE